MSIHQPSIAVSTKNSPYDGFLFLSALHPINAGADIDAQGGLGGTALYRAAVKGHLEIVKLMLDASKGKKGFQHWHCTGDFEVTLTGFENGGIVAVDGLPDQTTTFHIDGFDREWNWCFEDGSHHCAFVIKPSKRGAYYRYRNSEETTKPESFHTCTKAD